MRCAFVNGKVYTVDPANPWVEAMLVEDGVIRQLGTTEQIRAAAGKGATEIDLAGRMAMPGIHDAHIHLLGAGLKYRVHCLLGENPSVEQIVDSLCQCEKCQRGKLSGWIIGTGYNSASFAPGEFDRAVFDAAFPDTPVFLSDFSTHHGFANSAALALAGIDADTPDPFGGRYIRRPGSSEPTGIRGALTGGCKPGCDHALILIRWNENAHIGIGNRLHVAEQILCDPGHSGI